MTRTERNRAARRRGEINGDHGVVAAVAGDVLSERVLELRYGLDGEHPRTLDQVGRTFNVIRERIRQIENQSLKKLQMLGEAQKLRNDV